jgi:hypothetical protein
MTPQQFSEKMRQARLRSPLKTRALALKQFAEVEDYLHRHHLPLNAKPSVSMPKPLDSSGTSKS